MIIVLDIQNLSSFRLPTGFRGRSAVVVQLWWLVQATLFACSPQFMFAWRRWLLCLFGAKIGQSVLIRPSVKVTYPWKVTIGDHAWIGDDVVLYSLGEIEIGSHAVVSQHSYICAAGHDYTKIDFPIFNKKVCIGEQAWLATDVFVAPGVTVGKGTVVGARSSVFHDLPAMMVCKGSPAKPIKPRLSSDPCVS
ncbi:putative colanic acid biosynthesis acetyltransferase [Ferriphaselus sp. R-1]|uniref:putative colanic acid biosynthesis acetyltransferase n=1 Tax=Ferriphaselus sp. R-1 TaxID=1485544 RepID=UPI0009DD5E8B|nr:putative colanic acid biosynthesis acetyltransferase [Ferriphaselus sp. R-1]